MSTPRTTLGFGGLLVGLGLGAYALAARHAGPQGPSRTALIPAFYGTAFLGLGALASKVGARRAALRTAAALAGTGGAALSALVLRKMRGGGELNPRALAVQSITALLSLGYMALGATRPA